MSAHTRPERYAEFGICRPLMRAMASNLCRVCLNRDRDLPSEHAACSLYGRNHKHCEKDGRALQFEVDFEAVAEMEKLA